MKTKIAKKGLVKVSKARKKKDKYLTKFTLYKGLK